MKHNLLRLAAAALTLCLLWGLTACGQSTSGKIPGGSAPAETAPAGQSDIPASPAPAEEADAAGVTGEKAGAPASPPGKKPSGKGSAPAETAPSEAAPGEERGAEAAAESGDGRGDLVSEPAGEAQASLALLRQYMEGTRQAAAVAYLGYRDESERGGDLTDWLWTNVPGLMAEMAFLQEIPAERVLNGDYGELYCIVPRDERTSLAVNHVVWSTAGYGVWPEADEVLYRSEYAEPLLVFVRWAEFRDEPDIEVVAVSGSTEATWYPVQALESNVFGGYIQLPTGEDYEPLLMDFSSFGDVTGADDDGVVWAPPTELGLANTIWNCGNWMLELYSGDAGSSARLSCQPEDGQAYQLSYSGQWTMEYDCLRLELSAEDGTSISGDFPVYIDLSGERLLIQRDWSTFTGLPFFDDDANYMELTLSFG